MPTQPDEDAREIIEAMLDAVAQQAPTFKSDLRELVIERMGKSEFTDTVEGRCALPGTGSYARAFLDALEGFGLEHVADWYDNLSWDDTVLCDKLSVSRFLGPLVEGEDNEDDRVIVRFLNDEAGEREPATSDEETPPEVLEKDIADIVDGDSDAARTEEATPRE
ncbi:MAG: hypothetical protein ACOX1O_03455 [Eggerthellaceae bacterium]|jgi:hypothetical protein